MLVELAEILVDRCLQLLKLRSDQNKALFTQYIEPLMDNFEKLHETYMQVFEKAYIELSKDPDPISKTLNIGDYLHKESIFNSDSRLKVFSSLVALKRENKLNKFIESISTYLTISSYWTFQDVSWLESANDLVQGKSHDNFDEQNAEIRATQIERVLTNIRSSTADHFRYKVMSFYGDNKEVFRSDRLSDIEKIIQELKRRYTEVQIVYQEIRQHLMS